MDPFGKEVSKITAAFHRGHAIRYAAELIG
jgi:hypothetical protein